MSTRRAPMSDEEIARIIEMKLNWVPNSRIAETMGINRKTVENHWRKYKKAMAEERLEDTEMAYMELIARLQKNAKDCRMQYLQALKSNDHQAAQAYLGREQRALDMLAKYGPERDDEPDRARRVAEAQLSSVLYALDAAFRSVGLSDMQQQSIKDYVIGEVVSPKQITS